MKYNISDVNRKAFNASFKAKYDVDKILDSFQYHKIAVGSFFKDRMPWFHNLVSFFQKLKIRNMIYESDELLIQWPLYRVDNKFMDYLYNHILNTKVGTTLLIHDINSLRNVTDASYLENEFFKVAKCVIAHSTKMKEYLISLGVKSENIKVLTSFDYFVEKFPKETKRINSNTIAFAGNLTKSTFLRELEKLPLVINCYGKFVEGLSGNLVYKSCFHPNDLSVLEASWGLVWDGTSMEGCFGDYGDYLQYNAPHKLSLYIAASIPVIIWDKSGLANYVKDNKLGIVVSSLFEIPEVISNISESDYNDILNNVIVESQRIRNGLHLSNCINDNL